MCKICVKLDYRLGISCVITSLCQGYIDVINGEQVDGGHGGCQL
jgi:hypothetical protein